MRHHERRESLLSVYHTESTMQGYFKQQKTKTEDIDALFGQKRQDKATENTFFADKDKWNGVQ